MGDVFSYLFQLAHMLNIDLDEMWEKHKVKVQERRYADSTIKSKSTLDNDEPTPE
jgi:NTP pyrophosphatase (non-canonical NTP hydrolase)